MALDFLQMPREELLFVPPEAVHDQCSALLQALQVPEAHAEITAEILTFASLHGVDSHGAENILRYCRAIEAGDYTVPQTVGIVSESATTVLLDCGNGLGFVAAHEAMSLSIQKAREHGVGMAAVRHGHHIGMVGYYPMMAVAREMIGMAVTNASRAMRPLHGARPRLGTNPIAFAAPAGEERPFLLDMATTTVASGKLGLARQLGVPIPPGWAVTAGDRELTRPPAARSEDWAQTPLGNSREQGGHKGYGLAVMVDILAGVLSGGGFGTQLAGGENMAWTLAVDIGRFRPVAEFKAMMDEMIRELHATPPAPGADRVQVAGDPEFDAAEIRRRTGIPMARSTVQAVRAAAQRLGIPCSL